MAHSEASSPFSPYYEDTEKPIDYKYYFVLVKKNFNLISTFLIMGATLIIIYASRLSDQYEATAQILLERPTKSQGAGTDQQMVLPDIFHEDYYNTQREMMTGTTVLGQVVDELKLIDYFRVPDQDAAISQLKSLISIIRIRDSRLFNVTATTSDPQFSVTVANAVARAYIRKNFEDLLYFSKEILSWLPEEGEDAISVRDPFGQVRQMTM